MKRRTSNQGVGSLELLLDTICNTFGGILLISLLVALLLNATSREMREQTVPPQSHATLLQTEIDRERLARQLSDLQEAVTSREKVVGELLPAELIVEANRFHQAELQHAEFVERKTNDVGGASRAQTRLNEIVQSDADLRNKLEQARRDAATAAEQLAKQIAARSQDAAIPRVRLATTKPRVYFLTQKKLFGPWPWRQYASGNPDDFIDPGPHHPRVLLPKPGAGLAIPRGGEKIVGEVKAKFGNVDPRDEHVRIFVWPDSYAEFDPVRRAVSELGIMLELEPMSAGAEVSIGPQTTPAFVQ
jgi:hypothetical protein